MSQGSSQGPKREQDREQERARLIELLEANHEFPGLYPIAVVGLSYEEVSVHIRAALSAELPEPLDESAFVSNLSGGGKYRSHRVQVPCADAEAVLRLYERLRRIEGVVTVL